MRIKKYIIIFSTYAEVVVASGASVVVAEAVGSSVVAGTSVVVGASVVVGSGVEVGASVVVGA